MVRYTLDSETSLQLGEVTQAVAMKACGQQLSVIRIGWALALQQLDDAAGWGGHGEGGQAGEGHPGGGDGLAGQRQAEGSG